MRSDAAGRTIFPGRPLCPELLRDTRDGPPGSRPPLPTQTPTRPLHQPTGRPQPSGGARPLPKRRLHQTIDWSASPPPPRPDGQSKRSPIRALEANLPKEIAQLRQGLRVQYDIETPTPWASQLHEHHHDDRDESAGSHPVPEQHAQESLSQQVGEDPLVLEPHSDPERQSRNCRLPMVHAVLNDDSSYPARRVDQVER